MVSKDIESDGPQDLTCFTASDSTISLRITPPSVSTSSDVAADLSRRVEYAKKLCEMFVELSSRCVSDVVISETGFVLVSQPGMEVH